MLHSDKKIERMVTAARLYYEQNLTQSQIAGQLGVSRPLVSLLLTEARACGIVSITINDVGSSLDLAARRLQERFPHTQFTVLPDRADADETDNAVAQSAYQACFCGGAAWKNAGVGWGSMLGRMVAYAETLPDGEARPGQRLFPLIGGIGASHRSYHTNELVRVLSIKTGYGVEYLYFPAFFDLETDLEHARHMESYLAVDSQWDSMDLALVNISNFPSYPDLGVEYRFAGKDIRHQAVGRILAHYYDLQGDLILPAIDNAMQPSFSQLKAAPHVAALCSSLLRPRSVLGALGLGVIDQLFLPLSLAEQVLTELI